MDEIKIDRSNKIYVKLLVISAIAFVFSIRSLVNNIKSDREGRMVIIVFLTILVLLCTYFIINAIVKLFKKDPALILNDSGIIDNLNLPKIGLIEWKNISDCKIVKFTGSPHLVLTLVDNSVILSRIEGVKRKMIEVKVKDLGTPVAINAGLIDTDINELVKLIRGKYLRLA